MSGTTSLLAWSCAADLGHYCRVTLDSPEVGKLLGFTPKSEHVALGNCRVSPRRALFYAEEQLVGVSEGVASGRPLTPVVSSS
jgi:hypothetical protein